MPIEIVLAVLVVAALVIAVPVRRLVLDGFSGWTIVGYVSLLGLLIVGVTEAKTLSRFILPLLGLLYIAPFVTLGGGLDRLLGRRRPVVRVTPVATPAIAPPRNVTPPNEGSPSDAAPSEGAMSDPAHDGSGERPGSTDRSGPTA